MTLATHTIVGAAVATLFPAYPIIGFGAAFVSHFCLDAIPHWDYELPSAVKNEKNPLESDITVLDKRFLITLAKTGIDAALGLLVAALALWYFHYPIYPFLLVGALGGLLPDALQLMYFKVRREPLTTLQRFHMWLQWGRELKVNFALGIALQILIAVFIFWFIAFLHNGV